VLTYLSIRNYQSLHHVDLTLSPFTVIVGPSSSGKSALTRALRTLANNTRGSSFVSTWAKRSVIEASFAHRGTVTLTRGAKTDDNSYVLTTEPDLPSPMFTKLGGEVPEEVSAFLGIDSSITFADQFDRPYLLADSASEVARTFAALTNVHTVFAAAREANRTRLERSGRHKIRLADLEGIKAQREAFKALGVRLAKQREAEIRLGRAQSLNEQTDRLILWAQQLSRANEFIEATLRILSKPVPSLDRVEDLDSQSRYIRHHLGLIEAYDEIIERTLWDRDVPSLTAAEQAHTALTNYRAALVRIKKSKTALIDATVILEEETYALQAAQEHYQEELSALGHCPTCGQDTTHIHA